MTDYSELKRLAEALHGAEWQLVDGDGFDADNRFVTSQRRIDDNKVAFAEINYGHPEAGMGEPFQSEQVTAGEFIAAANPAAVLALVAENERMTSELEQAQLIGRISCNFDGYKAVLDERDQIKAENEALRKAVLAAREFIMHEAEVRGLLDENNEVSFRHPRRQAAIAIIDAATSKGEQA
ncbi:hypothetical protein SAMN05216205_4910 [Pseudomonas mohnii]|uniref:Ead/Ea22-like family protein n=1 Tax=Pseudomonas mohnii TaxID=395600 RepID=A0ABY0YC88_9PSED|nr:ead/Ea22-like family protein [Pseudomonas mohnii]SED32367.1 hypothetical protein SAMN05216205_4910 [Pseudomonas mohnii]